MRVSSVLPEPKADGPAADEIIQQATWPGGAAMPAPTVDPEEIGRFRSRPIPARERGRLRQPARVL